MNEYCTQELEESRLLILGFDNRTINDSDIDDDAIREVRSKFGCRK